MVTLHDVCSGHLVPFTHLKILWWANSDFVDDLHLRLCSSLRSKNHTSYNFMTSPLHWALFVSFFDLKPFYFTFLFKLFASFLSVSKGFFFFSSYCRLKKSVHYALIVLVNSLMIVWGFCFLARSLCEQLEGNGLLPYFYCFVE